MTSPFRPHGQGIARWTSVGTRQLGDERRERSLLRGEQLEQLAERRHRVVAGHDVGEDEAAGRGRGEDDAVVRRGTRQLADRVRRADDRERRAGDELVDEVGRRHGHRHLTRATRAREQPDDEEEPEVGRDGVAVLVDEQQPLCRAVEHHSELRAHAGHDPSSVERLELGRRRLLDDEAAHADRLDAERAEHERSVNVAGEWP